MTNSLGFNFENDKVHQLQNSGGFAVESAVKQPSIARRGFRCVVFAVITTIATLAGLFYLIIYLVSNANPNPNPNFMCNTTNIVQAGDVVIADGCTILREVNQARRRRLNVLDKRRLSFADVSRSLSGWTEPPLAYWTDPEGGNSPFANQLSYSNQGAEGGGEGGSGEGGPKFIGPCVPSGPVEGCNFYYETIVEGKVVDIQDFGGTSMRDVLRSTLYDFENFYWETGTSCESRIESYNENNFRDRFECGAQSFNDANRFINPFEVEMIRSGDVAIMTLPANYLCPEGVRLFDVSVYPVVYIEMLAHFYNIFVDLSDSPETAFRVKYDYTPRSWNDMVQTQYLPCVSRESVVGEVERLALQTGNSGDSGSGDSGSGDSADSG